MPSAALEPAIPAIERSQNYTLDCTATWIDYVLILTKTLNFHYYLVYLDLSRSRWPRGLRHGSTAARLLGLRVRFPPGAWTLFSSE